MSKNSEQQYQPVLLITEALLKAYSPLSQNVDIQEVIPFVSFAQSLYIEPILGIALTDELKEQIIDDDVSELNSDLILKIAPALSFWSVYQALPFLSMSILNKGVTVRNSENSTAVGINDLSQLRLWVKNDSEVFQNQLINFLCACKNSYPLWKPSHKELCKECEAENTGENVRSYDSGIYFKKKLLF